MVRSMRSVFTFFLAAIIISISALAENMKPEEIVARHLNSIGTPEARAIIKSRVVQGTLKMHIIVGGGGDVTGTWGRVSEQRQSNFVMRFATGGDWRGEQFIFDGEHISFATATTSHTRSVFAQFVSSQDFIVKEGLLGGELSTAWALQNLDQNHAKLQSIGSKKVDGKELIGLQYVSKGSHDMQVRIYFDPETFRHVMTVYTVEIAPGMAREITESVYQHQNRYTIEERFSDFQAVDGLTIPTHYHLQYTQEVQNTNSDTGASVGGPTTTHSELLGSTRVYDWDMTAEQIRHNLSLDAKNFRVR
jgi:hypothetical protein